MATFHDISSSLTLTAIWIYGLSRHCMPHFYRWCFPLRAKLDTGNNYRDFIQPWKKVTFWDKQWPKTLLSGIWKSHSTPGRWVSTTITHFNSSVRPTAVPYGRTAQLPISHPTHKIWPSFGQSWAIEEWAEIRRITSGARYDALNLWTSQYKNLQGYKRVSQTVLRSFYYLKGKPNHKPFAGRLVSYLL